MGIGDIRMLGRVGGKSFGLYILTTAIAIAVAICIALLIGPGKGFEMEGIDASGITDGGAASVWEVFAGIVPGNPDQRLRLRRDAADHLLRDRRRHRRSACSASSPRPSRGPAST